MSGNTVTLTFGGDSKDLLKAAKQAEQATQGVTDEVSKSAKEFDDAGKSTKDFGTKVGHLGSAVSGAGDAFDSISGAMQSVVDLEQAGAEKASRLAHAFDDVTQAQLDLTQALRDGKQAAIDSQQAAIDVEQAQLDATTAQQAYTQAVKQHGANSVEARQAAIDLKQAQADLNQANEDAAQATQDAAQAAQDATSAQHDLNDAQREAHPPELQQWADKLQLITPLLSAAVGILGLVTAAQWAWNVALDANPIGLIILAVGALVAVIVYLALKTKFFETVADGLWSFLKAIGAWFAGPFVDFFRAGWAYISNLFTAARTLISGVIDRMKSDFNKVTGFITAPFRAAFNFVADAWNNTIGRLHWSVPSWVPFVGGNSISAPHLPHFHTGGIVSGALGSETLAVLQAGERVSGGSNTSDVPTLVIDSAGSRLDELLVEVLKRAVERRGGNVQRVLGNNRV